MVLLKYVSEGGDYFSGIVTATMVLGVVMIAVLGYLLFRKKMGLEKIYPVAAAFLAVMMFLALPTYAKPDEQAHFDAAYQLSNRMMGYEIYTGEWNYLIDMRECDTLYEGTELSRQQYNRFGSMYTADPDQLEVDMYIANHNAMGGLPYLVSALGITLGRLLHLGFSGVAAMGTLFQGICFILAMTYALHKIPFGKRTLFVIALLPMTLQQANSFSYDSGLIAAAVVVTALALRWAWEKASPSEILCYVLAALMLLSVKSGLYAILLLLPLFLCLPKGWHKNKKIRGCLLAGGGILLVVAVIWLAAGGGERIYEMLTTRYEITWAESMGYSVVDYLTHPVDTIKLLCKTAVSKGGYYILTLVGELLGWIDIMIPRPITLFLLLLLLLSLVRTPNDRGEMTKSSRIAFVVIALAADLLCVLSMLVFWTPQGADVVEGVQGRYFIPSLLALCTGAAYWKTPRISKSTDAVFGAVMPVVDFAVVMCIYMSVVAK